MFLVHTQVVFLTLHCGVRCFLYIHKLFFFLYSCSLQVEYSSPMCFSFLHIQTVPNFLISSVTHLLPNHLLVLLIFSSLLVFLEGGPIQVYLSGSTYPGLPIQVYLSRSTYPGPVVLICCGCSLQFICCICLLICLSCML